MGGELAVQRQSTLLSKGRMRLRYLTAPPGVAMSRMNQQRRPRTPTGELAMAGARPTSKADAVSFDESEPDSPDDDRIENGRITLPTATTQPIAKFSNTAVQDAKPQGKVGAPLGAVH